MSKTQTICLTIGVLAWIAAIAWMDTTNRKEDQTNINHVFEDACERAGGVAVPSTTPGMVHCVQPVEGILP